MMAIQNAPKAWDSETSNRHCVPLENRAEQGIPSLEVNIPTVYTVHTMSRPLKRATFSSMVSFGMTSSMSSLSNGSGDIVETAGDDSQTGMTGTDEPLGIRVIK
jgi:hypothetical protein